MMRTTTLVIETPKGLIAEFDYNIGLIGFVGDPNKAETFQTLTEANEWLSDHSDALELERLMLQDVRIKDVPITPEPIHKYRSVAEINARGDLENKFGEFEGTFREMKQWIARCGITFGEYEFEKMQDWCWKVTFEDGVAFVIQVD